MSSDQGQSTYRPLSTLFGISLSDLVADVRLLVDVICDAAITRMRSMAVLSIDVHDVCPQRPSVRARMFDIIDEKKQNTIYAAL